jgi:hypothetical protein
MSATEAIVEPRLVMPSQRHSILAKARRYREEPDRLQLVARNPLTVVIKGFHADHTVVRTGRGCICSCDRSRQDGGQCAHVLAVEQRFGATAVLCATCELEVPWTPVRRSSKTFCCEGCAAGWPYTCSYDQPSSRRKSQ